MNAWEWIQSDPEVDRSQIYPVPCKQGLNGQPRKGKCTVKEIMKLTVKGAVGSADPKISKSALLSLNHHNFSNTKSIYTE